MAIELDTLTDPAILRRVWKGVRSRERKVHLTEIPLVRDSTGGVAFDLNLTDILLNLQRRLIDGTYRPHSPIIIESAKSRLLRRRLSFLFFEDAIILGSLVQAARPTLLAKSYNWVSFGRTDRKQPSSKDEQTITLDYEDWWTKWLRHKDLVKLIEGDSNPFLVTSDITNFFGSIDLSLLRNKFSGVNSLDTRATNLLFYFLEHLRPIEQYSPQGMLGLPVVQDDASRVMAHFYLSDLDNELLPEGRDGRYTRWVDDILVSVPNAMGAGIVMARIERTLSSLGLVANSSKTSLITKDEFRQQHHEEDNEYLDNIRKHTEDGSDVSEIDRVNFDKMLSRFVNSRPSGEWHRVLQRYYIESRRIRSRTLLGMWRQHLTDFPAQCKHILDYVAFFQGSIEFCGEVFEFIKEKGPVFEDIQILLYEMLLLKPFPYDPEICKFLREQIYAHFRGKDGFAISSGYVRGLQVLAMYKFAPSEAAELIKPGFIETTFRSPMFGTYGLPVLAACERYRKEAFEGIEEIEDSRILRVRALIERLEEGNSRTAGIFMSLLEPRETRLPTRYVVNARVLPLLTIAVRSRNEESRGRIKRAMKRAYDKVATEVGEDLIDYVVLEHIKVAMEADF